MRSIIGLLWALGGALAGFVVGAIVGAGLATATHVSSRDGAQGYAIIGVGLIDAIVGVVIALLLYGRSAPTGEGAAFVGKGVLGTVGLALLVLIALSAFVNRREAPLDHDGAMASLELELRVPTAELPAEASARALTIEVQTATTRPQATVLWSKRRLEPAYTVVPAVQQSLYRSRQRIIAMRVEGRHVEVFAPRLLPMPDPRADWSGWERPHTVAPLSDVVPAAPLSPIVELRYRVGRYGEE